MKHSIRVANRRKVYEHADMSKRFEVKVLVTYTDTEWRCANPQPFVMEYIVSVWRLGAKLWAWSIETPYECSDGSTLFSVLLSGNNGANLSDANFSGADLRALNISCK